jgi:hypothetical protein
MAEAVAAEEGAESLDSVLFLSTVFVLVFSVCCSKRGLVTTMHGAIIRESRNKGEKQGRFACKREP